jgi:hypothetical protein
MLSTPGLPRGVFHSRVKSGEVTPYEVRATECARITPEFLAKERRRLGPARFDTEYNLQFREVPGSLFAGGDIDRAFNRAMEDETDPREALERELQIALDGDGRETAPPNVDLSKPAPRQRYSETWLWEKSA